MRRRLWRFLTTPKGLLTLILAILLAIAAPREGIGVVAPGLASATQIAVLSVTNQAVCTSGDYERGGHILDPRTGAPADAVASATVVAPTAMLADALATAAFVLGPAEGIALPDRLGVDGLIVTPQLERYATRGLSHAS
ncbi:MAG TPA: FAD:protein FMN transferase [Candidatus Acidoferrum sp.]|nr:FAD:protein FMN transferase [Candidatus Acidoferrum sp.]